MQLIMLRSDIMDSSLSMASASRLGTTLTLRLAPRESWTSGSPLGSVADYGWRVAILLV